MHVVGAVFIFFLLHLYYTSILTSKPSIHLLCLDVALVGEPLCDLGDALLDGVLVGLDGNFRAGGLLVRGGDAGEFLDLTGAGLFVQALGVALLGDLEGHVDVDLDKGDGLVGAAGGHGGVQGAGRVAVGAVRRDEGGDGDGGRVCKELGDLCGFECRVRPLGSFCVLFSPLPSAGCKPKCRTARAKRRGTPRRRRRRDLPRQCGGCFHCGPFRRSLSPC